MSNRLNSPRAKGKLVTLEPSVKINRNTVYVNVDTFGNIHADFAVLFFFLQYLVTLSNSGLHQWSKKLHAWFHFSRIYTRISV